MKRYEPSAHIDEECWMEESKDGEYVLVSDIVQLVENSRFAERALYTGEFIKKEILSALKGDSK